MRFWPHKRLRHGPSAELHAIKDTLMAASDDFNAAITALKTAVANAITARKSFDAAIASAQTALAASATDTNTVATAAATLNDLATQLNTAFPAPTAPAA